LLYGCSGSGYSVGERSGGLRNRRTVEMSDGVRCMGNDVRT
jgi:hypothetical protein